MIVKIAGQVVDYQYQSLDIDDTISERSTASFAVMDRIGDKRFYKGQPVEIYEELPSYDPITANFSGKVTGSKVENGNVGKSAGTQTALQTPTGSWAELPQSTYDGLKVLDSSFAVRSSTLDVGVIAQQLFSFDVIDLLTRKFGTAIWQNATTLAEKVALAKIYVKGSTCNWYGAGSNQAGYKANLKYWNAKDGLWWTTGRSHTSDTVQKLSFTFSSLTTLLDSNGFVHFIAYGEASDGAIQSKIWTDFIEWVIELNSDATLGLVFSGVIDRPASKYLSLASNAKIHQISCTDWHNIGDRRIIAKIYTNTLAGNIVKDFITNYLAAEGVTAGTIQDGEIVSEAVFNYVTITRALDSLAELTGFEYYFDEKKALHFFHRATNYNDTVITETSDVKNLQVEPVAEEYRNRQFIRAGMDTTDPQTETAKGDGSTKIFPVAYPLSKVPTVKVNGITQTVGIRGVETGKQWYWSKGDNTISQDDSGTPLTSSQTITITYQGLFDIVVVSHDQAEISRMQGIEGGTGIHEHVIDDPYLTDRGSAFDSAAAKLARYAKVGNKVTFDTKIKGLRAGQLIPVKLASFGIDDYFLIESVRASELGTSDGKILYSVSVVDGSATGGWAKFFKQLANKGQAFVLRENIQENEVLTTLASFTRTYLDNQQPNIFKVTNPGASTQPGTSQYPAFEEKDRVKYIAFFNNNTELFRKQISKQTIITGQIDSTTYIAPFDANNVQITHVGWFGGWQATGNSGTGVLVDYQVYSRIKTDMEAIQIDKTDIKGW
jgi:hypothetical protein